ncbi:hypothetical protein [Peromfec virus RodF5_5]|uniref:Uncharacterized protein n=1 Tax=Peromfec virus RodF5_5 TaxID=2929341 RepID=A0A976N349_9VIRU|nr:hypothetical protein [Peromfec virus RodF5_5]
MISRLKRSIARVVTTNLPRVRVHGGLALSPAQMLDLSQSGVPIASQMSSDNFVDGDSTNDMSLDPMLMRGVDINDAWELQMTSRKNLRNANLRDISNYSN